MGRAHRGARLSNMEEEDVESSEAEVEEEEEDDAVQVEQLAKNLPKRSTRGQRMNKLIGDALEDDEMFWGASHGTWDDDEDDARVEYKDSGEEDSSDSDIDKTSDESDIDGEA